MTEEEIDRNGYVRLDEKEDRQNTVYTKPHTIEEQIEQVTKYLDGLEEKFGFPTTIHEDTINRATELMNMDFEKKLTAEECQTNALILSTYLFNLQRLINKDKSIVIYCTARINKIITPRLKQQIAYNYEERKLCAISEDNIAQTLNKIRLDAELRLSRIESNYYTIKSLADKFEGMARLLPNMKYNRND